MRISSLLLLLAAICLMTVPALADKETDKASPRLQMSADDGRDLFEGFEGAWPPAGWTAVSNSGHDPNLAEAWFQGSTSTFEGIFSAECSWDPDLIPQDNSLSFSYTIGAGEDHLNFQIAGSAYWSINYDVTVLVDGTPVYSWAANVVDNWVFVLADVDLSAYTGMTVNIEFNYTGLDGAAIYLDAVGINEGYEPPPPPEPPINDTCDGAIEIPAGAFSLAGDNTNAANDYPLASGSCTGYSFTGLDMVYMVCMEPGDVLDVTLAPNPIWDSAMYLVTDCADPFNTCVMGMDGTVSAPEVMSYIADATVTLYLIVGGYSSSGAGPFTLSGTLLGDGCIVPTENSTWGGMKDLYR